jgi:predicted Zn-dependent peptidase
VTQQLSRRFQVTSHSPQATAASVEAFEVDGLRVVLRANDAHEAVALRLVLLGGSQHLRADTAGIELLYARTARRGTQQFAKPQLHRLLDRLGIDLGASIGEDWTTFHLRCLRRDFDAAWQLFADVILQPLLEDAELEIVREQALLEIRQRNDSADGALSQQARAQAYRDHPYAHDPAGTAASVTALHADALRAHMQQHLVRRRLLLVAAGNLSRDDVADRVRQTFGALPEGTGWQGYAPPLRFVGNTAQIDTREGPTNYLMGQFAAPSLADPTHPATLMAISILRDRFFEEVRTKRNLSYAPSAGLGSHAANSGFIYVTAVDPRTTLAVMRNEMHKLGHEKLAASDLANKVQVYLTRYHLQNETNQAQASFLGRYELLGGGWERSRGFVERLEALQPADVQNAARAVLRNIQYTYLGNAGLIETGDFVDP